MGHDLIPACRGRITRRADRLLNVGRKKRASHPQKPRNFDFTSIQDESQSVFDLATAAFIAATKTHFFSAHQAAQKPSRSGHRAGRQQQGYRVLYRETHTLLEELAEAPSTVPQTAHGSLATCLAHHR